MKAFRFRLDPVLALRRFELDRARGELGAAERLALEADARRASADDRRRRAGDALADRLDAGVSAVELRSAAAAVGALGGRVVEAERQQARAHAEAAERRQRTRAAHTRLRALERLRERALLVHRREEARRAQRDLDEIGSLRAARRRSGS